MMADLYSEHIAVKMRMFTGILSLMGCVTRILMRTMTGIKKKNVVSLA